MINIACRILAQLESYPCTLSEVDARMVMKSAVNRIQARNTYLIPAIVQGAIDKACIHNTKASIRTI